MVNAPAQLATATALGVSPSIAQGVGANAGLAAAFGNALIPGATATSVAWPGTKNLGVKVELLLAGVWTDITQYVYQRNGINITNAGRTDWTATLQPAQLTLTVNNRDGRFTPKLAAGAYFPNIVRNTQIRVFVSATSSLNVSYSGYRFYGEVAEWPLQWDPSQHDIVVNITANGIWRRLSNLQTSLGSAFRRYFTNNATALGLQSYWPMEDGTGSGQLVPFASASGTGNALQQFVAGQAGLSLASASVFKGSDAIPTLNGASVIATVPSGGSVTANVTRFLLSVPQAGDSASGTTNWNLIEIDSAGTIAKFEVYLNASGTLLMQLRNSGGAVVAQGTTTTNVKGIPYLVSCELTSGGNFALRLIQQGASGITESLTGTVTGASLGRVTKVIFSRAFQLIDTAVGHLAVAYASPTSMVQAAYALNGYVGEFALDRFKRICSEMGIAFSFIGTSSAPMGPQDDLTLSDLLQTVEDTDCGLLYELRDSFGLGYRTNGSMANQAVQLTLNYAARTVDSSFAPSYDDQLTRNNVTVTNWTGASYQSVLTVGAMSILNPPSGIGNGYSYTRSVNAANDNQLSGISTFLLNVGTVDEIRFPVVTVKMVRSTSAGLFAALPNLRPGDYFQITNPPSFLLSAGPIKQLMWGYSETLNAREWTFALNTVPESPWETGFSPGTVQTAQIPGGSPVSSQAQGSLGLAALVANGSISPAMLSSGITVHTLGGSAITISVNAPANPNVNDIWINATTGLISQWNGSAWAPFKFDASATIIAGTIVTANIAASAITSSLIAAGTVVAGIVDATTVKAAEYDAFSTGGQFLAYDTASPSTNHLLTSIAGSSGTDTASNNYPQGLMSQQLTLVNQGSTPPAFSGASVLYSSGGGRLKYLAQTGPDVPIDRSSVNVANFSMNTQTLDTIIGAPLNYKANEGDQSSEYEIEIDGIATAPTSATGTDPTWTLGLGVDGTVLGASLTVGAVVFPHNSSVTVNYTVRFRLAIISSGAGGTAILTADGCFNRAATNAGNATNFNTTVGSDSGGTTKSFDTTSDHTIQPYAKWSSVTSTGHGATTYRTRVQRRD